MTMAVAGDAWDRKKKDWIPAFAGKAEGGWIKVRGAFVRFVVLFFALSNHARVGRPFKRSPWIIRTVFAKFCQIGDCSGMSTMNISLPDALRSYVDDRVARGDYGTSSEYVRDLIRKDQGRGQLRALVLDGAASPATTPVDQAYFDSLRNRVPHGKAG